MKKNELGKVKEGSTILDGIMRIIQVSTIHMEVYVNNAFKSPSLGKTSLGNVTTEPEN